MNSTAYFKSSAIVALTLCMAMPFLRFFRLMDEDIYKIAFLLSSAAWFLAATVWAARRGREKAAPPADGGPDSGEAACCCSDCRPPSASDKKI
jgi:hypothetical protein